MRNIRRRRDRDRHERQDRPADALMSILDFCDWAGISRRQYYLQRDSGKGPSEIRLGPRTVRVTRDEARAWATRLQTGAIVSNVTLAP